MFEKFDNIHQDYVPCNLVERVKDDEPDTIIVGNTCEHVFKLDFIFSTHCKDCLVIYKQSLETIIEKDVQHVRIVEDDKHNKSYIIVRLEPNETSIFKFYRTTTVQLKLVLLDNTIIIGDLNKVTVHSTNFDNNAEKTAFDKILPVDDYAFYTEYSKLDYENALKFYENDMEEVKPGACSSVRVGDFYGRNYDWYYGPEATFIVKTPRTLEHFATLGVAGGVQGLTKDFVESGKQSSMYKLVPFYLLDGINEYGVVCNTNVVPHIDEKSSNYNPKINIKNRICTKMLPRFVLDRFASATQAINYIRDYVQLYSPASLAKLNYDLHFMIADKFNTFVLEIVDEELVIHDFTNKTIPAAMTNFHLTNVEFNEDGSVYTPETQDELHSAIKTNKILPHGSGLERWNIINASYRDINSVHKMQALMRNLYYTNAYGVRNTSAWLSEFVGEYNFEGQVFDLTVDTQAEVFEEKVLPTARKMFDERTRYSHDTWFTSHSCVYDIENKCLYIDTQEKNNINMFEII